MKRYLVAALALVVVSGLCYAQGRTAARKRAEDKANSEPARPIRVLVPAIDRGEKAAIRRLESLKFHVVVVPWGKLEPHRLKDIDVILLPTQWDEEGDHARFFDEIADQFHRFVHQGGGLLVCQPNPTKRGNCTPKVLPYPITFSNWYDDKEPARINLNPDHFITLDLADADMPFPGDPILKIDPRYTVLAKQKSTDRPSLAVCAYGKGRIVVQTANESRGATIPLGDEIFRRMVVWAAQRDGK
ncbi:MAG: hypothetical protein L0Y72_22485 [Gemmataceae bacterium]|nr:hypothetical protein [Gemmataceae bacterium]